MAKKAKIAKNKSEIKNSKNDLPDEPRKLTPKIKRIVLQCFANGIEKREEIADIVGINRNTLTKWIVAGHITEEEIVQARMSMKVRATSILNTILATPIKSEIKPETIVKSALWYLERKYPEEYAQRIEQKIKIEVHAIIQKFSMKVIEVIRSEFPDPAIQERIGIRLREAMGLSGNDHL